MKNTYLNSSLLYGNGRLIVKENGGINEILETYSHENVNFFQKILDRETRIIYNAHINEFKHKKFISFGSGVARLNREAGLSPARSRHCERERLDESHCAQAWEGVGAR
jgi:hypothetical protein